MSAIKIAGMDLINRAKKLYGNKGFEFALREALTNAIHSCIMSDNTQSQITINITNTNDLYKIIIKDNGVGINEGAYYHITNLDIENQDKIKNNLPSFGQGRLSFIHFCDFVKYTSIYKDGGKTYKREFTYPNNENTLFPCSNNEVDVNKYYTALELLTKNKTAKTFFEKYNTEESFKEFILSHFFPLLNRKKDLSINVNYFGNDISIPQEEAQINEFVVNILELDYKFFLYQLKNNKENKVIECFARGLLCKLSDKQTLRYEINDNSKFYLESEFFDKSVNDVGDVIQIENDVLNILQKEIAIILDKQYSNIIANNKNETSRELKKLSKYPTFKGFIDKDDLLRNTRKPKTFDEIKDIACQTKVKAEIDYWDGKDTKYKDELIKSSLFDYFKYRQEVLQLFQNDFLQHFDDETCEKKKQNELKVHDIFFKRRKDAYQEDEIDMYFNHNLWLIDDKFSLFKNVKSAVSGEALPDIMCSPNDSNEINIIELKSTHKAWNEGEMIDKIKDYAKKIYNRDNKVIDGAISSTKNARYNAYLIASKSSIDAERKKLTNDKNWEKSKIPQIPFLENSYFHDGVFSVDDGQQIPIRIELITYEDLFTLANKRNKPIIDLMYKYKDNE